MYAIIFHPCSSKGVCGETCFRSLKSILVVVLGSLALGQRRNLPPSPTSSPSACLSWANNPVYVCRVLDVFGQDYDGQPLRHAEQKDVDEFCTHLMHKLENSSKAAGSLIQSVFGGTLAYQIICRYFWSLSGQTKVLIYLILYCLLSEGTYTVYAYWPLTKSPKTNPQLSRYLLRKARHLG